MKQDNKFIAYEYVSLSVDSDMKLVYVDCYKNFGWELEETSSSNITGTAVMLRLKRDRRIKKRTELNQLQRDCEKSLNHIYCLEHSKNKKAMMYSLIAGFLGTALIAGSVFSFLGGYIIACILLAIPGFIGWAVPYFIYDDIKRKQTSKLNPQIDDEYDNVYSICDKANSFI